MSTVYQSFTFKTTGIPLNNDNDFINAATNTEFEKSTGEVYTKTSTNIFDRKSRKIISQLEMDARYLNAGGDSLIAGHLIPETTNLYDLGSATKKYNNIYGATAILDSQQSGSIAALATNTYDIGTGAVRFRDIYANNLVGNADSASQVYSTEGDLNSTYYLAFGDSSVTGNASIFHDNQITVNPSTNTISCANFAGNASSSSQVYSTERDTNGTYYLAFGNLATSGYANISHDNQITVNPSTNTITCANFSGNASSASVASQVTVTRTDTAASTYYPNFSAIGTGNVTIRNDGGLSYVPSTNTLTTSVFAGQATSAQYADLAEKYEGDQEYPVGTVVEVGGDKEITLFQGGPLAGVISENPGLMINSEGAGQYVALKGKVPVKCTGTISKGQYCVAVVGGTVVGVDKADLVSLIDVVGVALADSVDGEVSVKI